MSENIVNGDEWKPSFLMETTVVRTVVFGSDLYSETFPVGENFTGNGKGED